MTSNVLYKYVAPERIDILLKWRVRFTQPCFLNDPFEFNPGMSDEDMAPFEKGIARERSADFQKESRIFGVLSLTEKWHSIPMWAHYAAAHTGFAIGFDVGSPLFEKAIGENVLRRVTYRPERVGVTRGLPGQSHVGPNEIYRTKSTDWAYEEEWRWIERRSPSEYAEVVAGANGELLFLRRIPPKCIREITLGFRASCALDGSIRALKSSPDYEHLEVYKVSLNESHYSLEREAL